jgi:hypothetical protein
LFCSLSLSHLLSHSLLFSPSISPSFFYALGYVFIIQEFYRTWKSKSQTNSFFLKNLNLIKNQIWKRITIIVLMIRREWQTHIIVPSFLISWQITLFIEINPWSFNFKF